MITDKIGLKGIFNARDLGGFPVGGGRRMKRGRLIRSDALRDLTDEDIRILTEDYGLRNVIDLRTPKEVWEKPDPEIEGVTRHSIPLIESGPAAHKVEPEKTIVQLFRESIEAVGHDMGGAMKKMYEGLLTGKFTQKALAECFGVFLGCEEGSTLFHCTAGKDRTGLIAILMLDAFGADRKEITEDYLATNDFLRPQTQWIAREIAKHDDDPKLIEQVNILNTVYPEYAESIFEKLDAFGGAGNYLKEAIGLSEGDIADLKRLYTE